MTIGMARQSACIEMLFGAEPDFAARVGLAQQAGFTAVEFWLWSTKDLDALQAALQRTGVQVVGFVAEPMVSLNNPADHATFLAALPASITTAQRPAAPFLYIQGGSTLPGVPRAAQTAALVDVLGHAADLLQGSGVTLLLEPVSDARDGFLSHARDGLAIVAAVQRPEVRLLYDLFHAAVAGEDLAATVGAQTALIGHVHVADHPGRRGSGTGVLDLTGAMDWLRAQGYQGWFGMEHRP